ncbi:MAG: RloB domain-containing protein [Candidatus Methanomethylophilaceae archaeon]|nr:RloB domain-containing protein [Candidatus Methanomethylophilaceae archaeon]
MRSVTNRFDPERRRGSTDVRSKFIFAFEGHVTEGAYFKGVAENRSIAGIGPLVGICVLQREEVDSGCSGPTSMMRLLRDNIRAMRDGCHNIGTIRESVRGEIAKRTGTGRRGLMMEKVDDELPDILSNCSKDGTITDMGMAKRLCDEFIESITGKSSDIFIPEPESYDPEIDHVCVIVDRDRDAHSPKTMDCFISECRESGFEPYICNPCFEFWLMLHFDEVLEVDRKKLSRNEFVGDRRFTEVKLDEIINGINPDNHYDKTKLDPLMFMHRIGDAVRNNRYYCSDIVRLKHDVGTNLGELFERMM